MTALALLVVFLGLAGTYTSAVAATSFLDAGRGIAAAAAAVLFLLATSCAGLGLTYLVALAARVV